MSKVVRTFRNSFTANAGKGPGFHYTQCGLDDIYLLNGYERGAYEGKPWFSVKDIDGLHRAIGLALVTNRKTLSPKEWRFLRKQLDMTQVDLANELGLSSQQVARYEKGESEIGGPADMVLRILFLMSVHKEAEGEQQLRRLLDRLRSLRKLDEAASFIRPFEKPAGRGWKMAKAA
jgi:DNA-binding transcriptional regulator YiaG